MGLWGKESTYTKLLQRISEKNAEGLELHRQIRNNANDTADRIEAYAKKSGMEVVETIFNTDKKAVERLRYYIERDAIICVLVRDVVDISMELNEIKAVMTLAAEHGISINAESRGYEPALISLFARHGRALTGVSPEHAQVVGNV